MGSNAKRPESRTRQAGGPRHVEFATSVLLSILVLSVRCDHAMKRPITITINGTRRSDEVEPRLLLIHYLREVVGLTGPHIGCETSICGACTVHARRQGGQIVHHVRRPGGRARDPHHRRSGRRTVSSHAMQEAFWNEHGLQCGFCTPGMIMTSKQLLERNPNPTEDEIRHGLEGNLCRCTGYQHIVNAVERPRRKAGA